MSVEASQVLRRDIKAMGLIGLAHGTSHFFQLVLATLLPVFVVPEFGVGYAQVGALMTLFFVTSGLGQPLAGFLVDRLGAKRVLFAGLATYCAGLIAASLAPSFALLFPAIMIAAIGNCVFHPVDFTILNGSVSAGRLGRAFSVHTLGGNLGWAAAPAGMLTIASLAGWRLAMASAAAVGLIVLLLLILSRHELSEDRAATSGPGAGARLGLEVLFSPAVVSCFAYFVLLAAALIAVQNFLPPTLAAIHETPLVLAGTALTGFLLGASAGVLCGGLVADRYPRHGVVIAGGLLGAALTFLVVSEVSFPAVALVAALGLAGFLQGITTPSRDLLVRSVTPRGATGRVFGFVYSGLDVGSALAPVTVGIILDKGDPRWIFWLVALMLFLAIFTAVSIGQRRRLQAQPAE